MGCRVNQRITSRQRFNDREMTVWRAIVAKVPHFFEQVGTINALVQTRKQNFAPDSSKLLQNKRYWTKREQKRRPRKAAFSHFEDQSKA